MKVRRLGTEADPWTGVEINYNLISFSALLRHLRRLPGLTVTWSKSWLPTDDHWADLKYKRYPLLIDSEFVDFTVCRGEGCPEDVFLEVVTHLETYEPWWPNRVAAAASERYRTWRAATHTRGLYSVVGPRQKPGNADELDAGRSTDESAERGGCRESQERGSG